MKLRLIPVSLACAALVGGLATASAQANTTAVKQVNQSAATKEGPPGVAPGATGVNAPSDPAGLSGAITGIVAGSGSGPPPRACVIESGTSRAEMGFTPANRGDSPKPRPAGGNT